MAERKLTIIVREMTDIGFMGLSRWRETQTLRNQVNDEDFAIIQGIMNKQKGK